MKKGLLIIACACSAVILSFGVFKFTQMYAYSAEHFPESTVINGVDCSGLTAEETVKKLSGNWNSKSLRIKEGGKTIGTLIDFDFTYDIEKSVNRVLQPGILQPQLKRAVKSRKPLRISMKIEEATPAFLAQVESLEFLDAPHTVVTADAYVDKTNTDFKVVKEVYGDNIDKDRFTAKMLKHIADGIFKVEYKKSDYYAQPKVLKDSKELVAEQEYCKKYLTQVITYQFHTGDVAITPAELDTMLAISDKGVVTVDEKGVEAYVDAMADERNTVGRARNFTTASGRQISVSGGNYGYLVDRGGETAQLIEDLKKGKDVTREPLYSRRPYVSGANEIGSSYIELSIGQQTLWLFKDGNQVLSTSVVTGNVNKGAGTPTGVYSIAYLDRNTVLRGPDWDGGTYESPVSYWMPFNGGIGFHDATWRDKFGGNIYTTGGSHGCVNMPSNAAAILFNNIRSGFPVVVRY